MIQPVGIQLRRTARFRLQNVSRAINGLPAFSVARPGRFGNPFLVRAYVEAGYKGDPVKACVDFHRAWLEGRLEFPASDWPPVPDLTILRGHNLACWCPLDGPCHRNTLIELANR